MKKRLDILMMERALAPSREKAKAYIMAGDVYVGRTERRQGGNHVPGNCAGSTVRGNTLPYVSRGGLKLEKAMNIFRSFSWMARSAWMWELLQVDLQTVCSRTVLSRFIP